MRRSLTIVSKGAALVFGAVFCVAGCSRDNKAGRAARAAITCERLCRLVVRSSDSTPAGQCHRGCLAQVFAAGPACETGVLDWMDCASAGKSPDNSHGWADAARAQWQCAAELASASVCAKDCQRAGILQSGEAPATNSDSAERVAYELKYHGCVTCVAEQGAGPSAPCSAAKVCASSCYVCTSRQSSVSLRACVQGHCATATDLEGLWRRLDVLGACRG